MAKHPTKPRRGRVAGQVHSVDIHVGSRVRMRRAALGLSQEKLGESLGLSFQQVQKYERGTNRISASRLYEMGNILGVPVSYFFEEFAGGPAPDENGGSTAYGAETMNKRETLSLVRAYYRIKTPAIRRRMLDLIKAMARA